MDKSGEALRFQEKVPYWDTLSCLGKSVSSIESGAGFVCCIAF